MWDPEDDYDPPPRANHGGCTVLFPPVDAGHLIETVLKPEQIDDLVSALQAAREHGDARRMLRCGSSSISAF